MTDDLPANFSRQIIILHARKLADADTNQVNSDKQLSGMERRQAFNQFIPGIIKKFRRIIGKDPADKSSLSGASFAFIPSEIGKDRNILTNKPKLYREKKIRTSLEKPARIKKIKI